MVGNVLRSVIALLFLLLLPILPLSDGARILFSGAVDSGTHIGSMVPLIKRLASSGHQVTVLELATLDKPRDLGPNVSVQFIPVPVERGIATALAAAMFREVLNGGSLHLPYIYGNGKFKEFMETNASFFVDLLNGQHFDLVILDELFGVHSFAIALPPAPTRGHSLHHLLDHDDDPIDGICPWPGNFVAEPNLLTSPPANSADFYAPGNVFNRLDNLRTIALDLFRVYGQIEWFLNSPKSALKLLGLGRFSFRQLFSQASFIFADYLDRVPAPLAEGPDVLPISAQCATPKPLPPDLAEFVEAPQSEGTILVAFGTNVHWRFAPEAIVRAFFLALNRLIQHRIIFSYNGILPDNITLGTHLKVVPWTPQYDLLAHPRTKLFISHAGLKSFKETLCAKVPVVYMPVYAEQSYNTKVALRLGFATAVNKMTLTEAKLTEAIQTVLANFHLFKANAARANSFFLDRPLDGLSMAEFGVRRAIRGKGMARGRWRKWRERRAMAMDSLRLANGDLLLALAGLVLLLAWS